MPTLKIADPGGGERVVAWDEGSIGIGRDRTNLVALDDDKVSRWHAAIFADAGPSYRVRDLGSSSGVRLGRTRIRSRVLQDGDEIGIGPYQLTFLAAARRDTGARGRGPFSIQLPKATDDPLGQHPETQELRAPDWTDAGWGLSHAPGPTLRELFISVQAVASTLDLDEMLACLLVPLDQLAAPSVSFAALVDEDSQLDVRARRTRLIPEPGQEGPAVSQSTIRRAVASGQPILAHPAIVLSRSMQLHGIMRALCLPLVAGGRVRGIVYADWRQRGERPVEESRLEWLAALALYAGSALENALHHDRLQSQHERLQQSRRVQTQIVGVSDSTRQLLEDVDRCAARDVDVLILGPTGSGKELVARRIHERSKRCDSPFVAVNCASIPRELFESELFGHTRGAFTGAHAGRLGRFQEANGGTLFLDEFGELALDHQARLLRALEERSVTPIGGRPVALDLRVIAATNRDLQQALNEGTLRADLFNRLGVPIQTSPLKDRPEDIPILAYYLLDRLTQAQGEDWRDISPKVMESLLVYAWPGNVRELGRCLRNALVFAGEKIDVADLRRDPEIIRGARGLPPLEDIESDYIRRVLRATRGNQAKAAAILGVAPNTLKKKMDSYRIRRDDFA